MTAAPATPVTPQIRIKAFSPKVVGVAMRAAAAHLRLRDDVSLPPEGIRAAVFGLSIFFDVPGPRAAVLAGMARDEDAGQRLLSPGYIAGEATGKAARSVADALNWAFKWKRPSRSPSATPQDRRAPQASSRTGSGNEGEGEVQRPAVGEMPDRSINHPGPGGVGGPWSDAEREALKAARLIGERWADTLKRFPGRTMNGIRAEFGRMMGREPGLALAAEEASARARAGGRGPRWTAEEDAIVIAGVEAGKGDAAIAAELTGRSPEAVRSRRVNALRVRTRPTGAERLAEAKSAAVWTPADDAVIAEVAAKGYSAGTACARLPRHDRELVTAKLDAALCVAARKSAQPRGEAVSSGPAIPGAVNRGISAALSLDPKQCKWPVGDPREPDFHFCGETASRGHYCAGHAAKAYSGKPKRRRKSQDTAAALDSLEALREARERRGWAA